MQIHIKFCLLLSLAAISCSKKTGDVVQPTIPERIVVAPLNRSISPGDTVIFKAIYYNNSGVESPLPASVSWTSSNNTIANVTQAGVATGIKAGQVTIKAQYNAAFSTALLSVVDNDTAIATISLQPVVELNLNDNYTFAAIAKNINGIELPGKNFTWQTDNANLVSINASTGRVTAKAYGTANITASTNGLVSNPSMVQVRRIGSFMGAGSAGMAKLKVNNGLVKLETSADFRVSTGAPDLRIYFSANSGNVNNAIEVATLNQRSGAQSWNLPFGTTISQYRYVLVWCKQFGGAYGVADLGN